MVSFANRRRKISAASMAAGQSLIARGLLAQPWPPICRGISPKFENRISRSPKSWGGRRSHRRAVAFQTLAAKTSADKVADAFRQLTVYPAISCPSNRSEADLLVNGQTRPDITGRTGSTESPVDRLHRPPGAALGCLRTASRMARHLGATCRRRKP